MPRLRLPGPALLLPLAAYGYFYQRHYSTAYLAGGAVVVALGLLAQAKWARVAAAPWGRLAFFAIAAALPALGAWQSLRLEDVGDIDHASYSHALWNLGRGNLEFDFHGRHLFGIHSMYTVFAWVPVKWLAGDLGLKLAQGACLAAAMLLAIRRYREDRGPAWWAALALLLCPAVASQFVFGFHPETLAAPLLVLALDAYREERLGRFLILAAVLAYTKETFTLAIGGILLLALVERRSWKWWLLPGLLVTAQMALYWFALMPRFAPEGNHLSHFMPATPAQVLASWARSQNLFYVLHILLPFLPVALASPKRYLLLPLPLMAFYAAFPDPLFVQMWPNYAFPAAILAAGALILRPGLRLVAAAAPVLEDKPSGPPTLDGRLLVACATLSVLAYPLWRDVLFLPRRDPALAREIVRLRDAVPDSAAVLVNGNFAVPFASRKTIALWGWRDKARPLEDFDFILIDPAYTEAWLVDKRDLDSGMAYLADSPRWERMPAEAGLQAFRRKGNP